MSMGEYPCALVHVTSDVQVVHKGQERQQCPESFRLKKQGYSVYAWVQDVNTCSSSISSSKG